MPGYEDCIIFLLAKAHQYAQGTFKKRLTPYGLTPIQYLILEALSDHEGISASEIGEKLVLDKATLSGILDRLNEKGWITKEVEAEDRRNLRLLLSDKSRRLMDTLFAERQKVNKDLLANFSLEEKILLKRMLQDIYA